MPVLEASLPLWERDKKGLIFFKRISMSTLVAPPSGYPLLPREHAARPRARPVPGTAWRQHHHALTASSVQGCAGAPIACDCPSRASVLRGTPRAAGRLLAGEFRGILLIVPSLLSRRWYVYPSHEVVCSAGTADSLCCLTSHFLPEIDVAGSQRRASRLFPSLLWCGMDTALNVTTPTSRGRTAIIAP